MKKQKFRRTDSHKYSKLGIRRKKKQIYRKAKGRDNKIRLNMKGHLKNVRIGFKRENKTRGLVKDMKPVNVYNVTDLKNLKQGEIGIIGKVGDKKRAEISDYAIKNNIKISNINPKKFLEKREKELEKIKDMKSKKAEKKKIKEKKAKEAEKRKEEEKKDNEKKEEDLEKKVEEKKESKEDKKTEEKKTQKKDNKKDNKNKTKETKK